LTQEISIGVQTPGLDKATKGMGNLSKAVDKVGASSSNTNKKFVEVETNVSKNVGTLTRLEGQYKKLNARLAANKITVDTHRKGTAQLEAQMELLNRELVTGVTKLDAHSAAAARNNSELQKSQKGYKQFSLFAQQAGFQVGDFATQIASGQSALVAFIQQFTQLAGFIPGIGFWGAIAGAVLAVGGAIAVFIQKSKEAKDIKEVFEGLEDSISSLKNTLDLTSGSTKDLTEEFGRFKDDAVQALTALKEIQQLELNKAFDDVARSIIGIDFSNIDRLSSYQSSLVVGFLELSNSGKSARDAAASFATAMKEVNTATGLDQQVSALTNLSTVMEEILGPYESMSESQKEIYKALQETIPDMAAFGAETQNASEYASDLAEYQRETRDGVSSILEARDKELTKLTQQLMLQSTILQYGEDSTQVKAQQLSIDEAILRASLEEKDIKGNNLDLIVEIWRTTELNKQEIEASADAAKDLDAALRRAASAMSSLRGFSQGLEVQLAGLVAEVEALETGANAAAASLVATKTLQAEFKRDEALATAQGLDGMAEAFDAYNKSIEYIEGIAEQTKKKDKLIEAGRTKASAGSKKTKEQLSDLEKQVKKLNETYKDGLDPLTQYYSKLDELETLKSMNLSDNAYAGELQKINDELIKSTPLVGELSDRFADFIVDGFKDFKDFASGIVDLFKNSLKEMIAAAIKSKIVIPIATQLFGGGGVGGGSGGGGAPSVGGQIAGGVGSKVMGSLGKSIFGSFGTGSGMAGLAGGTGFLGGAGNVIGGLSSGGISGAISGFGASMGSFATALGAIAVPLAAAVAVFSFFKKKVTELDSGIKLSIDGIDSVIETFRTIETKRFWGLSKKVTTEFEAAEESLARPVQNAINELGKGILNMAGVIGQTGDALNNFSMELEVSTKGLSDQDAQRKIQEAFEKISDGMAETILAAAEGITIGDDETFRSKHSKVAETSSQTLSRLSQSLSAVNATFLFLNKTLYETSIQGAVVASELVELFGGVSQFTSTMEGFFANFYNQQEQFDLRLKRLTGTFSDLNKEVPQTKDQFRELVEAQDLTTEAGRETYAALLLVSGEFSSLVGDLNNLEVAAHAVAKATRDATNAAIQQRYSQILARFQDKVSIAEGNLGDIQRTLSESQSSLSEAEGVVRDINAGISEAERNLENSRSNLEAANRELESANKTLVDVVEREKGLVQDRIDTLNDRIEALKEEKEVLQDLINLAEPAQKSLTDIFNEAIDLSEKLMDAYRDILGQNEKIAELQRKTAQKELMQMRESGVVDADSIDRLINSVSGDTTDLFATSTEYKRDQIKTANLLKDLADIQGDVASEAIEEAKRQTELINAQIALLDEQILVEESEIERLDAIIAHLVDVGLTIEEAMTKIDEAQVGIKEATDEVNVNMLKLVEASVGLEEAMLAVEAAQLKVDESTLQVLNATTLVEEAVARVEAAIVAIGNQIASAMLATVSAGAGAAGVSRTGSSFEVDSGGNVTDHFSDAGAAQLTGIAAELNKVYKDVLDRNVDIEGLNFYGGNILAGITDIETVRANIAKSIEASIVSGIPAFASGGMHSGGMRLVGENGPELEVTGPSRIYDTNTTKNMMSANNNSDPELKNEFRDLKRTMVEVIKHTKKTADTLRTWDGRGIPEERVV